jgi:hypothetical protein
MEVFMFQQKTAAGRNGSLPRTHRVTLQWFLLCAALLVAAVVPFGLNAEEKKQEFSITFSGFVKNDFFYDSRQTVTIREGHFLLYPAPESLDAEGEDINGKSSLNFLSIQTRLTGTILAPDAFGAKVKGVIEADFFGNENAAFVDANGFRLRHAYAQLSWKNTQLLFGQYWHPLFIPACYSEVVSFNTGSPIQPFSRNPQLRLTHKFGRFSLMAALSTQRDFTSPGGSAALRNSALPELQAQVQYQGALGADGNELLAGFGGGFKTLHPLLSTDGAAGRFAADENVSSYSLTAFAKAKLRCFTVKLQGVYGTNLYDLLMLGGYGVHEVIDPAKNSVSYTPFRTMSIWSEFQTNGKKLQFGLWAGYTANLGAGESVAYYSNSVNGATATVRGNDIKSLLRLSPRLVLTAGKFSFALETEYTSAAYAARDEFGVLQRDEFGVISETDPVANLRALFAVILKF